MFFFYDVNTGLVYLRQDVLLGDALATAMFPAASLPRREETIVSKRMQHTEQAIDRSNRDTGY